MRTMDQGLISQQPMKLRHAIREGETVGLTFRSNVYAAVVPVSQREREIAELTALRARVAELERELKGAAA